MSWHLPPDDPALSPPPSPGSNDDSVDEREASPEFEDDLQEDDELDEFDVEESALGIDGDAADDSDNDDSDNDGDEDDGDEDDGDEDDGAVVWSSNAPAPPPPPEPKRWSMPVLFEDEHMSCVSKAVGLSTVSERWRRNAPTVIGEVWKSWQKLDPEAPRPHLIHRLDKETSGVLLFAKHRDAQVSLRQQFRERTVKKCYHALVEGVPQPESGRIDVELNADPRHAARQKVWRGGKRSITDYRVLERFNGVSWVELTPLTGRTHQIRVSMAHLGNPCAVDPLYGGSEALYLSRWKRRYRTGRGREERPLIARVTLHASRIEFAHPIHGTPVRIDAPLPKDLRATLQQLRRWGGER